MNIAVTDGLVLMPPAFRAGLGVWSREEGTPGSATYDGATNAAIIPADQDFGTCLEMVKTQDVQRLRYMAETPMLPGTYLRVSARIKTVSGAIPTARISAWPGSAARAKVPGLKETGTTVTLGAYGEIVEVSAIVGSGARTGVDMAWGTTPIYGHFGLDLLGDNGGAVRIESIRIEDVTSVFLRTMIDWVDVRDFGAVGDGTTDCFAAFQAADNAANGGYILVPDGTYLIGQSLTIRAPIRFKGKLTMPRAARLVLMGSFDYPSYADAFADETEGLKKGIQALLGYTDHGTLDLRGRRVDLTEPIMVNEITPGLTSWSNRRVISNGQVMAVEGAAWNTRTVTSQASYDIGQSTTLSNVANIANIEVGSRITGAGVGREVYVRAKNVGAQTLTLSQPLYGGSGTRQYTFHRYRYVFDFTGMEHCARIHFADVDFILNGIASGIMLPENGEMFHIRDCFFTGPKDRGITSIGRGCQDLLVDRCQFLSNEMSALAQDRTTVAINVNANDSKIRDNRIVRFAHFMVAYGTGHLIVGNHWFQGDGATSGLRTPGLIFTLPNCKSVVTGNYIDNNTIEWTNEHSPQPNFGGNEYSFGGLTITGNTFTSQNTSPAFSWLSVKPYGTGHHIHGLAVTGNVFRSNAVKIDRVDRVDTSFADLDYTRMRNIQFEGNTFNGVDAYVANPVSVTHMQATAQASWTVSMAGRMPFNGWAKNVDSLVAESQITNASGTAIAEMPWVQTQQGTDRKSLTVNWTRAVQGKVTLRVRMDNPD